MADIVDFPGVPTNGQSPLIDTLVWGGRWTDADGGKVSLTYALDSGPFDSSPNSPSGKAWEGFEADAMRRAFDAWSAVANIEFTQLPANSPVDFSERLLSEADMKDSDGRIFAGWHEPPDPSNYFKPLFGAYNYQVDNWTTQGLANGGLNFSVLLHEIGHGLGLAHPHDGGNRGDATRFPGVVNENDLGDNGLNQSVFTLMSYNDGWKTQFPNHVDKFYGYVDTPMALDIAAIQALYGANTTYNAGNTVYSLPTENRQGTSWECIWDAGGEDTISVGAVTLDCTIDLNAAPLVGPNAGGFASTVQGVVGGLFIANSVVIENAIGGMGNDVLRGNGANNLLQGMNGNDTLLGGNGGDRLEGGAGADSLVADGSVLMSETANQIVRLYLATLGRGPDDAGLAGWTGARDAGRSLTQIATGFVNSAEFQAKYGTSLSQTAFVTLLYENVLHRAPDSGGLDYWVNLLNSGTSREGVVTGFSESAEFIKASDSEWHAGEVYRLYGATLARQPDAAGFEGWVYDLDNGRGIQDVAAGFVGSPEFQTKYGALSDTDFVSLLYQNVLGRAPDAGGLADWLRGLTNGASRTSVVVGFSDSPEYVSKTTASLKSFMTSVQPTWNDSVDGDAGNDNLFGGHGADRFTFSNLDNSADHVYGLEAWDTIALEGFGYASKAAALSHLTTSGANVVFSDQGDTITFHQTTLAEVQALDWVLA